MQKNASFLAIVAVHTAENEPSEVGEGGRRASFTRFSLTQMAPPREWIRPAARYAEAVATPEEQAGLKDSIGERPNHSEL